MSKVLPKKRIEITIGENDYVINYPKVGQFVEVEAMKSRLTRDTYTSMTEGGTVPSQMARYTVDMIAFLSVCCPKIKADLNVDSFSDLEMIESKKILKVYVKDILPWIAEWEFVLNAEDDAEETVN
jgi:hypothetical protein